MSLLCVIIVLETRKGNDPCGGMGRGGKGVMS